jgi:hypothetical protein
LRFNGYELHVVECFDDALGLWSQCASTVHDSILCGLAGGG